MTTTLKAYKHSWLLREPFAISRGISTHGNVIIVELGLYGDRKSVV